MMMFMLVFLMIVMMVFMFLILILIVVMVMMFVFFFVFLVFELGEAVAASVHRFIDRLAAELIPRGGDDSCVRIQGTDDFHIFRKLLRAYALGAGEDNACGGFDLIIEELLEVPVIDLAAVGVHHGGITGKFESVHGLNRAENIRKLADTGRFDDDPLRMIGFHNLPETFFKISLQGTADTPAVDFADLNAGFLQETAVDSDLAEFVLNKNDFLIGEYFFDKFGDQGCLSGTEKSRYNICFRHKILPPCLCSLIIFKMRHNGQNMLHLTVFFGFDGLT